MTISYDELFKIIREFKTEIKDSSVKSYAKTLFLIQKHDFNMKNEDSILEYFNNIKLKTYYYIKNNLSALSIYLQINNKDTTKIKKKIYNLKMEHDLLNSNNVKSSKDKLNWVTKKELLDIYNEKLKVLISLGINKSKKKILTTKEKRILQDYLIMSLYLLIPPRRNLYANTKFITSKLFKDLDSEIKENNNYLVYTNRNKQIFSLGDWKNSKVHGRVIINIPSKLCKIISLWYKYNKDRVNNYLLINLKGNKLTTNNLTKNLVRIFSGTGKSISSTMIRKIMISENDAVKKYNESKNEVKKLANDMGHSVKTQQSTYYKK